MEGKERKKIEVKFVDENDVPNIFEELQSERLPASKRRRKRNFPDEKDLSEETSFLVPYRSSCLFENGDVAGQNIFGFQTPKHQNVMARKASECGDKAPETLLHLKRLSPELFSPASAKSKGSKSDFVTSPLSCKLLENNAVSGYSLPFQNNLLQRKVNATPNASKKLCSIDETEKQNFVCPMTPYNLRRRFKKKLAAVSAQEKSFSFGCKVEDFSDSGSDWERDMESESSSSSENEEESDCATGPVEMKLLKREAAFRPSPSSNLTLSFVPAVEEYFQSHSSKKILTSNHTLGKLRYNLPQEKLQKLLSETILSHEEQLEKLQKYAYSLFSKWHFLLREGFNILLYGVGSKQNLLNTFCQKIEEPCVVVNGFFPSLTIQEIVSTIAEGLLGVHSLSADLVEAVDYIRSAFSEHRNAHLFLVVHNIDGVMLRNDKSQEVLAYLADTPNIHLIATIDHISSPLMWDQNILSMFNFSWWDTTTFLPYAIETAFEGSLLVQQSGNLALSSLQNVFRSLTTNAKNIFLLMAEYQKEHKNESNYSGMPFKKLYTLCRESLLVSSDLALRSQLTEFLDHRLVKSRRGYDGSELLTIPIDASLLDEFVLQQSAL